MNDKRSVFKSSVGSKERERLATLAAVGTIFFASLRELLAAADLDGEGAVGDGVDYQEQVATSAGSEHLVCK